MEEVVVTSENTQDLPSQVSRATQLPQEKRIELTQKGIWVQYPLADELIRFLEGLDSQPRRPRMMGRTLVGPTGNGKTSIIQQFRAIQRARRTLDDNPYEYLYVLTPPNPTIRSMYVRILSACHFDVSRGSAEELWQKVVRGLGDLNVRMLFLDDVDHLLNSQNERVLNQCRDVLKDIANQLMIPIVLVGTDKAEGALKGNPQVVSRYPVIHLDKWNNNASFRTLLRSFERGMVLRERSNLDEKETADRIYELSGGTIGGVSNIITECAADALKRGEEKITLNLINELHESRFARF